MSKNSELLNNCVEALTKLPGIGKKSAMRIALHLLNGESEVVHKLSHSLIEMKDRIRRCKYCRNICDDEICHICSDRSRDQSTICVLEELTDLLAVEETRQYNGVYHILGGVISPIEGIGPEQLNIESLMRRIKEGDVKELIMAINPTIDGETTIYYLSKKVAPYQIKISLIARGVAFGGELQYTDEVTLGRSIITRTPYALNGD